MIFIGLHTSRKHASGKIPSSFIRGTPEVARALFVSASLTELMASHPHSWNPQKLPRSAEAILTSAENSDHSIRWLYERHSFPWDQHHPIHYLRLPDRRLPHWRLPHWRLPRYCSHCLAVLEPANSPNRPWTTTSKCWNHRHQVCDLIIHACKFNYNFSP
jgi:hypothetical protein